MRHPRLKIAVIGGGINGVMSAWMLAKQGCDVVLLERSAIMSETSSASTKLLHGGLRYLEHGSLGLVRESLRERQWWVSQAPQFAEPMRFVIPVYKGMSRSRTVLRLGLWLYDTLAGSAVFERHANLTAAETARQLRWLRDDELLGGFSYTDVQMDDAELGRWAARRAVDAGIEIREACNVLRATSDGMLLTKDGTEKFDRIVNAAGPWAGALMEQSGVRSRFKLRLVRGSHLVVKRQLESAVVMQVPEDGRIVFAIPWKGNVLLGTTEVEQESPESAECSDAEAKYLLGVWNRYFRNELAAEDVIERFAGVRPLVREQGAAVTNTREFELERIGKLINVFGGKWTTARLLGQRVASLVVSE